MPKKPSFKVQNEGFDGSYKKKVIKINVRKSSKYKIFFENNEEMLCLIELKLYLCNLN